MKIKKTGNGIVVRLDVGEKVNESLEKVAQKENLGFCSVQGIGAVEDATLGYLGEDGVKKDLFSERREFLCLGNISEKEGKTHAHIHAWLGDREKGAVCGHLVEGKVSVTVEAVILPLRTNVGRKIDENINYPVLDL